MLLERLKRFHPARPPILLLVMGAMLLISLVPIGLYHSRVLKLSQRTLEETEPIQQSQITRALAEEVQLFESNLYQQLISERQILSLTGLIDDVDDPAQAPQVARLLENFVQSSPNVLYLTAVGRNAKGSGAPGRLPSADRDPFVSHALQRAFTACVQSLRFQSDPLAIGPQNRPAFVMAVPLQVGGQFTGMLAAVVSLDKIRGGCRKPASTAAACSGGPRRPHRRASGHAQLRPRHRREFHLPRRRTDQGACPKSSAPRAPCVSPRPRTTTPSKWSAPTARSRISTGR